MNPFSARYITRRLGLLGCFSALLVAALACSTETASNNVAPEVGHRAPSFQARLVGGETLSFEGALGNGVILNFWATWCGPCKRELPLLDRVAAEGASQGITVIGVNMGEPEEDVREFLYDYDLVFPIALDATGTTSRLYAVPTLPMTFFIEGDGIIRYRRAGELRERHIAEGLSRIR